MKFGSLALAVFLGTWPIPTPADSSTEHLSKGETLFAAKNFAGAIHEYREAVRLNPRDPKATFRTWPGPKIEGRPGGSRFTIPRSDPTSARPGGSACKHWVHSAVEKRSRRSGFRIQGSDPASIGPS